MFLFWGPTHLTIPCLPQFKPPPLLKCFALPTINAWVVPHLPKRAAPLQAWCFRIQIHLGRLPFRMIQMQYGKRCVLFQPSNFVTCDTKNLACFGSGNRPFAIPCYRDWVKKEESFVQSDKPTLAIGMTNPNHKQDNPKDCQSWNINWKDMLTSPYTRARGSEHQDGLKDEHTYMACNE